MDVELYWISGKRPPISHLETSPLFRTKRSCFMSVLDPKILAFLISVYSVDNEDQPTSYIIRRDSLKSVHLFISFNITVFSIVFFAFYFSPFSRTTLVGFMSYSSFFFDFRDNCLEKILHLAKGKDSLKHNLSYFCWFYALKKMSVNVKH